MIDWKPIAEAKQDGTVYRVKNALIGEDIRLDAAWLPYKHISGRMRYEWVLVKDHDDFMPMMPGTLLIPTHYAEEGADV